MVALLFIACVWCILRCTSSIEVLKLEPLRLKLTAGVWFDLILGTSALVLVVLNR